jgi:hypothetical protein
VVAVPLVVAVVKSTTAVADGVCLAGDGVVGVVGRAGDDEVESSVVRLPSKHCHQGIWASVDDYRELHARGEGAIRIQTEIRVFVVRGVLSFVPVAGPRPYLLE